MKQVLHTKCFVLRRGCLSLLCIPKFNTSFRAFVARVRTPLIYASSLEQPQLRFGQDLWLEVGMGLAVTIIVLHICLLASDQEQRRPSLLCIRLLVRPPAPFSEAVGHQRRLVQLGLRGLRRERI